MWCLIEDFLLLSCIEMNEYVVFMDDICLVDLVRSSIIFFLFVIFVYNVKVELSFEMWLLIDGDWEFVDEILGDRDEFI